MDFIGELRQILEGWLNKMLDEFPQLERRADLYELKTKLEKAERREALFRQAEAQKQQEILDIAKQMETRRAQKQLALQKGRKDLAAAAEQFEEALRLKGNQFWAEMTNAAKLAEEQANLQAQYLERIQKIKLEVDAQQSASGSTPDSGSNPGSGDTFSGFNVNSSQALADELDAEFSKMEIEDELERMRDQL